MLMEVNTSHNKHELLRGLGNLKKKMLGWIEKKFLTVQYRQESKQQEQTGGRKETLGCLQNTEEEKEERQTGGETEGAFSVLTSLGFLTSLKDSGESSVVVVVEVETVRPAP